MATEDDNWDAFMSSIGEPDEEVETDEPDSEEDENPDEDPKPKKKTPKKSPEAAKGGEADDEDEPEEDDPDETADADDPDKDKKPKKSDPYKPRLKQFLNDDGELDPERIEKSYMENSKETVRIKTALEETNEKYDRLLEAIKAKPDVAKELFGEDGAKSLAKGQPEGQQPQDPYSRHIQAQINKQSRKDYEEFVELNPEAVTDPTRAQKIGKFLKRFGRDYAEDNDGELPTMKEGLEAAYRYYGWDVQKKEIDKKDKVAIAAKKAAASRRTPNKKTPAPKKKKSDLQDFFANKLGVKVK